MSSAMPSKPGRQMQEARWPSPKQSALGPHRLSIQTSVQFRIPILVRAHRSRSLQSSSNSQRCRWQPRTVSVGLPANPIIFVDFANHKIEVMVVQLDWVSRVARLDTLCVIYTCKTFAVGLVCFGEAVGVWSAPPVKANINTVTNTHWCGFASLWID